MTKGKARALCRGGSRGQLCDAMGGLGASAQLPLEPGWHRCQGNRHFTMTAEKTEP